MASIGLLDSLWSKAVKKRDNNRCALCGSSYMLEAHHVQIRKHKTTRWNIDNGIALCYKCHGKCHSVEIYDKIRKYLGEEKIHAQSKLATWTLKDYLMVDGLTVNEFREQKKSELKKALCEGESRIA